MGGPRLVAIATALSMLAAASIAIDAGASPATSVSPANSTVKAFPSSVASGAAVSATVTVTVEDSLGHPIAGHAVSISAGSGSSVITVVSGTSDANGQATFKVKDPAAETVTYTGHDDTDSVVLPQTSEVFVTTSDSPINSSMVATPSSLVVGHSTSITVTLKDGTNNPLSGHTVSVVQDGPSSINAISPITNGSGQASFTASDDLAETAVYYALDGGVGVKDVSVTFTPGPLDHLQLAPASATVAFHADQAYTAMGLDQYGNSLGDVTSDTTFSIAPDGSCTGASCSGSAPGGHTVTGDDGGKTGTATLTVLPVPREAANVAPSAARPRGPGSPPPLRDRHRRRAGRPAVAARARQPASAYH